MLDALESRRLLSFALHGFGKRSLLLLSILGLRGFSESLDHITDPVIRLLFKRVCNLDVYGLLHSFL